MAADIPVEMVPVTAVTTEVTLFATAASPPLRVVVAGPVVVPVLVLVDRLNALTAVVSDSLAPEVIVDREAGCA